MVFCTAQNIGKDIKITWTKELPRIPRVKGYRIFLKGYLTKRKLGALHVEYENSVPFSAHIKEGDLRLANIEDSKSFFRVEK